MMKTIPGGSVLWARTIFQSAIWNKHPQYFHLFFWLVGNANHNEGYPFRGHVLMRGQLITTYARIADALSYFFNNALLKPSIKEIRIILSWLQSEGMITVKPLIDGASPSKGRPPDLTRAYLGLLITVINYDSYQDIQSYKGRHKGRPPVELGQLEQIQTIKTFSSDSIELRLSELLLGKILSRNQKHKKPNLQTWAKDVDLMIRIDHRTPEEIRAIIEWCQDDPFWKNNILSTGKLREKFDQLSLKMAADAETEPAKPWFTEAGSG